MTKDVLVKLKGRQINGSDDRPIELDVIGTMEILPDAIAVSYEESQTIQGGSVKTCLTVNDDNTVVLERSGDLNSKFIIAEGRRKNCLYSIPQGTLALGVYGKEVISTLSENGGSVKLIYTVDVNMCKLSDNMIEITVEEMK